MATPDHIRAACGQLRTTWAGLAETVEPGPTRPAQHIQTDTARARLTRLGIAERADRHAILTSGRIPTGSISAPARIAAIDARRDIADDIDRLAWELASHLRRLKVTSYRPHGRDDDLRFTVALNWIAAHAAHVTDRATLHTAHARLVRCDQLARTITGAGPDRRPLTAECPACGRRSLAYDTSSIDYREWHVMCTRPECRCDGYLCNCKLPTRYPNMSHVWVEARWDNLAALLNNRDAA